MTVRPYFAPAEYRNTALRWAIATRMQLDRWEPLAAWYLRESMYHDDPHTGLLVWRIRTEYHLCVISAAHLVRTLGRLTPPFHGLRQVVRDEIIETRDLLEHWQENQPIFNQRPRPANPPMKTGKTYAARNPQHTPYLSGRSWDSKNGPWFTPNVFVSEMRALIARVEAYAVEAEPALEQYVPDQVPLSLWLCDRGWWPLARAERVVPAGLEDGGLSAI